MRIQAVDQRNWSTPKIEHLNFWWHSTFCSTFYFIFIIILFFLNVYLSIKRFSFCICNYSVILIFYFTGCISHLSMAIIIIFNKISVSIHLEAALGDFLQNNRSSSVLNQLNYACESVPFSWKLQTVGL